MTLEMSVCCCNVNRQRKVDLKNRYGNKKNVIGYLLEKRYANGHVGIMLHATTNLTADQRNAYYGGRVVSRMRKIFNFIELRGKDRRK